jgi:hypothetical protein
MSTYDTLDNERRKAVCELRKLNSENFRCKQFMGDLLSAIDQDWISKASMYDDATLNEYMRDRLIHLLGGSQPTLEAADGCMTIKFDGHELRFTKDNAYINGVPVNEVLLATLRHDNDECNFSGSENDMDADNTEPNPAKTSDDASNHVSFGTRSDGTMGQPNETCPNDVPLASITDELRRYVAEIWDGSMYVNKVPTRLLEIADRTDEQFDRICKQHEAVLQATIDAMVDERDRLMEQRFELQQSLREVAECLDLHNMHELYGYKIDAVTKLVVGAIYKLVDERDELQTECDRLTKALDEIQAEPVNDIICRIERERDELLVKLEGYDQTHMKLPLDRKGVIVRPGDMVRLDEGILTEVMAVSEKNIVWQDGDYPDHPHLKQRVAHNVEVPRPEPDTVDRIAEGLKSGKVSVQEAITRLQDMARREAATNE